MPRFARIFFISLLSAAGSCSGEQLAQKQMERKDIRQQLATTTGAPPPEKISGASRRGSLTFRNNFAVCSFSAKT